MILGCLVVLGVPFLGFWAIVSDGPDATVAAVLCGLIIVVYVFTVLNRRT